MQIIHIFFWKKLRPVGSTVMPGRARHEQPGSVCVRSHGPCWCFSLGLCSAAPVLAPVTQPRTARITKEAHSALGASLWKAILKLTCLLFVGSKVKLLTLPSIHPSRSLALSLPARCRAVLRVLYLHGLKSFHAEEKGLVHSQSPRSRPCCPSGHIIHWQTMTIL